MLVSLLSACSLLSSRVENDSKEWMSDFCGCIFISTVFISKEQELILQDSKVSLSRKFLCDAFSANQAELKDERKQLLLLLVCILGADKDVVREILEEHQGKEKIK